MLDWVTRLFVKEKKHPVLPAYTPGVFIRSVERRGPRAANTNQAPPYPRPATPPGPRAVPLARVEESKGSAPVYATSGTVPSDTAWFPGSVAIHRIEEESPVYVSGGGGDFGSSSCSSSSD